jgi:hypothetical protein
MTAPTLQALTADVFWQHYEGTNYELVRGGVVEKVPMGGVQGVVAGLIYLMLTLFSRSSETPMFCGGQMFSMCVGNGFQKVAFRKGFGILPPMLR